MSIQEKVRQLMVSEELSEIEKREKLRALIPARMQNRRFESGDPAQLKQLQEAIEAALAMQQLDAEEFREGP